MVEILETVEPGNIDCGESETPSSSSSVYQSCRIEGLLRSRTEYETAADFEIAASKVHWSELRQSSSAVESSGGGGTQEFALSNREILESLRRQFPRAGRFFVDIGDGLQLGRKIAEGGQAEIFELRMREYPNAFVYKVFKEGSSVLELQRQWPAGMLNLQGRNDLLLNRPRRKFYSCCWPFLRNQKPQSLTYWTSQFCAPVFNGTVLMNGRFAFVMRRFGGDLRTLIDMRMLRNSNAAPFSAEELERSMLEIAMGMDALHRDNIVHRDLKAANILIDGGGVGQVDLHCISSESVPFKCVVADFECSVGVVGTRFWRAPEILQGVKARNITPDLFTKASDVYSYGMTCYEMITGQIPFEGVKMNDYDVVLQGNRPTLPKETEPWICKLLNSCWQPDPNKRLDFFEIIVCLVVHMSKEVLKRLSSPSIDYLASKFKLDSLGSIEYA